MKKLLILSILVATIMAALLTAPAMGICYDDWFEKQRMERQMRDSKNQQREMEYQQQKMKRQQRENESRMDDLERKQRWGY